MCRLIIFVYPFIILDILGERETQSANENCCQEVARSKVGGHFVFNKTKPKFRWAFRQTSDGEFYVKILTPCCFNEKAHAVCGRSRTTPF